MNEFERDTVGRGQSAKEQVSAASAPARRTASDAAGTAAEQARGVAGQAREQAGDVVETLRGRVTEQAQTQTQRAAGALREWADELDGLAQNAPGDSPAQSLAAQTAKSGHRAADYLDNNGVDGLVGDLQGFARRRPGAFLGGAALAGVVVGRLVKAGKASSGSQGQHRDRGEGRPDPGDGSARPGLPDGHEEV